MRRECPERTFSPPARFSDPDMHHGTCVTHVPWCMSGSLTSDFLWSLWRGKRSWHSQRMRNPQFCVSVKRPMEDKIQCCVCWQPRVIRKKRISCQGIDLVIPKYFGFHTKLLFWYPIFLFLPQSPQLIKDKARLDSSHMLPILSESWRDAAAIYWGFHVFP